MENPDFEKQACRLKVYIFETGIILRSEKLMPPLDLGSAKDLFLVQEEEPQEVPSGNDLAVLETLSTSFEDAGAISFQGIRRKLGLHQETLSRSLHRLERDGLVSKTDHDYKISKKGTDLLTKSKPKTAKSVRESLLPIPILRTILPPDATELELERALSHKWFGTLRWYGSSRSEEGTVLSWTTDDGKLGLLAKISDGYLSVESQATTKESMEIAIRAAYEIFDHISKVFKHRGMIPVSENSSSLYRAA
jgi:DNA-binding MarR family transcriptional regulator